MDKKRLTKILVNATSQEIASISLNIKNNYQPIVIKEPSKTLAMIQIQEPVKQSTFYLGEVIVCEAIVEIDGVKGAAILQGDDLDKVLDMAVIDAAINKKVFTATEELWELESIQKKKQLLENALHLETIVNFDSLDQGVPNDLNAFKKT